MTPFNEKVGEVIRVEWDQESNSVRIVVEITNEAFKSRVLHSKDLEDVLSLDGKDVMIIAKRGSNAVV